MENKKTAFWANSILDKIILYLRFTKVIKLFKKQNGGVVYDLGCGTGYLIDKLDNMGFDSYGIDVEKLHHKVFVANLNDNIPFDNSSGDIVVSLAVIEHLENPEKFLSEIYRILKPQGKIILTTPSKLAKPILEFLAFKLKIIDAKEISDHKRYYSLKSLQQALKQAGFDNIKINSFMLGMNLNAVAIKK